MDLKQQSVHPKSDQFLVCGLGSLGQQCVSILKEFGAVVGALDKAVIEDWEIPQLPEHLLHVWVGDCRQTEFLAQAQVQHCPWICHKRLLTSPTPLSILVITVDSVKQHSVF